MSMNGKKILDLMYQSRRQKQKQMSAAEQMRMKTAIQGKKMMEDHLERRYKKIVPRRWRRLSDYCPPIWWFKMWYGLIKVVSWIIHVLTVRPFTWLHNKIWMLGCYTEMEKISEFEIGIAIFRWGSLRYRCIFDWRNGKVSDEMDSTIRGKQEQYMCNHILKRTKSDLNFTIKERDGYNYWEDAFEYVRP